MLIRKHFAVLPSAVKFTVDVPLVPVPVPGRLSLLVVLGFMIAGPVTVALQHYRACGRCLTTPLNSSDITPQRDRQKRKTN